MDACVRGFSFVPETKIDVTDLQYIEGNELERSWKATRRQRLREQEQRIWKEFVVNEQDVLSTFCKDDPYQFLEQLPQDRIEELLKLELQKMRLEKEEQDANVIVESNLEEANTAPEITDVQHTVTFVDEGENEDSEMFHIFDDDDKDDVISDPEEDALNDSMASPSTVREKPADLSPTSLPNGADKASSKSSENVNGDMESSIYCAKVKDLRMKLSEELAAITSSLQQRDFMSVDPDELVKMCRRSTEFSARFNRIHLYQMQRQIHDVKRNSAISLPFAKHTQFQSQMVRIVSLHQNMLHSFQVFHKSFEQTACARESVDMMRALIETCREATLACSAAPAPASLTAAKHLYDDNLSATCDILQATVDEHGTEITNYMHSIENTNTSRSKGSSKLSKDKKRSLGPRPSKSGAGSADPDARLSMYSLDTLRWGTSVKPSTSKGSHSNGRSKLVGGTCNRGRGTNQESGRLAKNATKKSPRPRRPLMRDPQSGQTAQARRRLQRETDIQTMVQSVDVVTCTSSRDMTPDPPTRRKDVTPRRASKEVTPRNVKSKETSSKKPILSAAKRPQTPAPHGSQRLNLKNAKSPKALKSDIVDIEVPQREVPYNSVIEVLCAKKDTKCDFGNDNIAAEKIAIDKGVKTIGNEMSPRGKSIREKFDEEKKTDEQRNKAAPARCEVTRIVRQLCGGDASGRSDRASGAKNAKLLCVTGGSPRQPSTPQLLRILEETIQKKVPKPLFQSSTPQHATEQHRLVFNVPESTTDRLFQYRTQFVQHMITSPMYANSVVGKPWEVIGRISEQIIDDLLTACAKEMELPAVIEQLYNLETR